MSGPEEESAAIGDARNGADGEDDFEVLAATAEEAAEAEAAQEAEAVAASIHEPGAGEAMRTDDATAVYDWDDDAALMLDLTDAMHTAATSRHARALEMVERRRAAHVQKIRERAEEEAATAQSQAERDVTSIVEWADAEISRIQAEKVRRGEARERELDALLDRHRAQIEWEIEAVDAAVQAHRANLDGFYARLATEPDAATIAQLAAEAPRLPDLESISLSARARSVAAGASVIAAPQRDEPAAVAVMDVPEADAEPAAADIRAGVEVEAPGVLDLSREPELPDASEAAEAESQPEAEVVGVMAPAAMTQGGESSDLIGLSEEPATEVAGAYVAPAAETERVEASATPERGTLLQAISVLRPTTSWWNHGQNESKD